MVFPVWWVGNDESLNSVAHLAQLGLGAGSLIMCLTYRECIDERVLAMFDLLPLRHRQRVHRRPETTSFP